MIALVFQSVFCLSQLLSVNLIFFLYMYDRYITYLLWTHYIVLDQELFAFWTAVRCLLWFASLFICCLQQSNFAPVVYTYLYTRVTLDVCAPVCVHQSLPSAPVISCVYFALVKLEKLWADAVRKNHILLFVVVALCCCLQKFDWNNAGYFFYLIRRCIDFAAGTACIVLAVCAARIISILMSVHLNQLCLYRA